MLFEGKSSAYEGGFRVPAIAWWPGTIKPNQTNMALATAMDIYPTVLKLAGIPFPEDRKLDGVDLYPLLINRQEELRNEIYYYTRDKLYAVRKGPWKAYFITKPSYKKVAPTVHDPPLVYNVEEDPSEKYEIGAKYPQFLEDIQQLYNKHLSGVDPVLSQLDLGY